MSKMVRNASEEEALMQRTWEGKDGMERTMGRNWKKELLHSKVLEGKDGLDKNS